MDQVTTDKALPFSALLSTGRWERLLLLPALGLSLLWAYWPTFSEMAERWSSDPQYSHGYLVPVFALFLLWLRRPRTAPPAFRAHWLGLPLVAVGAVLH